MGQSPKILLVVIRYASLWFALLSILMALSACERDTVNPAVNAAEYDSFWLWAGVKPQHVLEQAKTVYILEGEVRASDAETLVSLRPGTPDIDHADIWMVIRVESLDLPPEIYRQIFASLAQWSAQGNNVVGLQIDFDANTRSLDQYAIFLRALREQLPEQYALGITGLLDWSANGDPSALASLAGVVDEAVFQVYQGRKTIPGYEKWLNNIGDLPMPFRIGLVQGGEWKAPESLASNPSFRGYVIFLVNSAANEINGN